jgi:histone H3/H4
LKKIIKNNNINNINKEAIILLENYIKENIRKIISLLREEMIINGRKTLKKKDVHAVFERFQNEEYKNWEI